MTDTLLEPFRAPHAPFAQHRSFDVSQFVVTRDYGKNGFESVSHPEWTRESIIRDIIEGQVDRVVSVVEFNSVEGWSNDITDDIRMSVIARQAVAA